MNKILKKTSLPENRLVFCSFCNEQFHSEDLCPTCKKRDTHHGKVAPRGSCQQCLEKGLKLTKLWNKKYYCDDCQE
jgi:hypothetical protein